jgi:hypothetical protein
MDFSNRPAQPPVSAHANGGGPAAAAKKQKDKSKWNRIAVSLIGAAVVILLVGLIVLVGFSNNPDESKYVNTDKLQAVFLNTGQVYFGNIKSLNSKYFVLTNIYYLQTSSGSSSTAATTSSSSNSNVTLVKLGCEIHQPYDQMVINADEVTFWENLQSTGQVAQAVATFQKENPNGQKCSDQSSSSSSTTNSVQNAGTKQ